MSLGLGKNTLQTKLWLLSIAPGIVGLDERVSPTLEMYDLIGSVFCVIKWDINFTSKRLSFNYFVLATKEKSLVLQLSLILQLQMKHVFAVKHLLASHVYLPFLLATFHSDHATTMTKEYRNPQP